jgi:hypothetical protein
MTADAFAQSPPRAARVIDCLGGTCEEPVSKMEHLFSGNCKRIGSQGYIYLELLMFFLRGELLWLVTVTLTCRAQGATPDRKVASLIALRSIRAGRSGVLERLVGRSPDRWDQSGPAR